MATKVSIRDSDRNRPRQIDTKQKNLGSFKSTYILSTNIQKLTTVKLKLEVFFKIPVGGGPLGWVVGKSYGEGKIWLQNYIKYKYGDRRVVTGISLQTKRGHNTHAFMIHPVSRWPS